MKEIFRCWAEIDLDALRENLSWIRHGVGPGVKIMTVVKADAYSHGLKQIAALLMQSGTDVFGVANLAEARMIHRVGLGGSYRLTKRFQIDAEASHGELGPGGKLG